MLYQVTFFVYLLVLSSKKSDWLENYWQTCGESSIEYILIVFINVKLENTLNKQIH